MQRERAAEYALAYSKRVARASALYAAERTTKAIKPTSVPRDIQMIFTSGAPDHTGFVAWIWACLKWLLLSFFWYLVVPCAFVWTCLKIFSIFYPTREDLRDLWHRICNRFWNLRAVQYTQQLLSKVRRDWPTLYYNLRYNAFWDTVYRIPGKVQDFLVSCGKWGGILSFGALIIYLAFNPGQYVYPKERPGIQGYLDSHPGASVPWYMGRPRNEDGSNYLGPERKSYDWTDDGSSPTVHQSERMVSDTVLSYVTSDADEQTTQQPTINEPITLPPSTVIVSVTEKIQVEKTVLDSTTMTETVTSFDHTTLLPSTVSVTLDQKTVTAAPTTVTSTYRTTMEPSTVLITLSPMEPSTVLITLDQSTQTTTVTLTPADLVPLDSSISTFTLTSTVTVAKNGTRLFYPYEDEIDAAWTKRMIGDDLGYCKKCRQVHCCEIHG